MFEKSPVGATHYIARLFETRSGGTHMYYVHFFKQHETDGSWLVYTTDNDNEYPQWVPVDVRRYFNPDKVIATLARIPE